MDCKRIGLEDFQILVFFRELRVVVAREAHGGLRQIVGAEAEELGFFGDLVGGEGGARDLDHGADHIMQVLHAGLCRELPWRRASTMSF